MTFSFLYKNEDGSLQFQGFNMNAMISFVYDKTTKAIIVLLKHKFKHQVPVYPKNGNKPPSTFKNEDRDLEYVINRSEDIERFIKITSFWMTPLDITNLIGNATIEDVVLPADN